jgi:hypothetical protein
MAFVHGFENDVFVSYAHADNEVDALGDAWVHQLQQNLRIALKQRLGRGDDLNIYFDARRLQGNHPLDEILDSVRKSAVFLAVGSPSYVNRQWTRDELAAFVAASDESGRLFALERLPLDPGDRYPDPLHDYFRISFWQRDQNEADIPLTLTPRLNTTLYYVRLQTLAEQIRGQLVQMANRAPRTAVSMAGATHPAPQPMTHGAPPQPHHPPAAPQVQAAAQAAVPAAPVSVEQGPRPVLVAQVTEDLEYYREQVISHLTQFNIPILPLDMYPQGGEEFRAAVTADLQRVKFFVQLLGPASSRKPRDLPEGYLVAQSDLAAQAGIPILQWRSPDLVLDSVPDPVHRAFLAGDRVEAVGLESFKAKVVSLATAPPPPPPPPPPSEDLVIDSPIFINANPDDQPIAEEVFEKARKRRLPLVLSHPVGTAEEVRQDFERNWRECDSVVLIYGNAPQIWVRNQIMLYNKLKREREKPLREFILMNCPPQQKPPVGIALPEVEEIDCREGLSAEILESVVLDLAT